MDTTFMVAGGLGALLAGYFIFRRYRKSKSSGYQNKIAPTGVASILSKDSSISKAMSENPVLAKTAGFSYM